MREFEERTVIILPTWPSGENGSAAAFVLYTLKTFRWRFRRRQLMPRATILPPPLFHRRINYSSHLINLRRMLIACCTAANMLICYGWHAVAICLSRERLLHVRSTKVSIYTYAGCEHSRACKLHWDKLVCQIVGQIRQWKFCCIFNYVHVCLC